jgi:hypothetical protein
MLFNNYNLTSNAMLLHCSSHLQLKDEQLFQHRSTRATPKEKREEELSDVKYIPIIY